MLSGEDGPINRGLQFEDYLIYDGYLVILHHHPSSRCVKFILFVQESIMTRMTCGRMPQSPGG
jgi:hypothetical protein